MLCCDTARETFASFGLFTFARTACLINSLAYLEYNIRYNIVTTVLYISEYVNHMGISIIVRKLRGPPEDTSKSTLSAGYVL